MGHGDRLWINLGVCAAPGAVGSGLLYPFIWTQLLTPRCSWWILTCRWLEPCVVCGTWIHLFTHSFNECFLNICLVVQPLSPVRLFAIPWTAARQASLSFTISQSFLKLMSIESVMSSNRLILLPSSPPTLNLSQHQGFFQWLSSSHQAAKVLVLQHQSFQWLFVVDSL